MLNIWKTHWSTKPSSFKKKPHISKGGASSVQVSNFNIFEVIKSTSRSGFSHYLLSTIILIFRVWVPSTTTKGASKKIQFKQHFATTFRRLTKTIMVLVYHSTFPYTWLCLLPMCLHFSMLVYDMHTRYSWAYWQKCRVSFVYTSGQLVDHCVT